ncbi:J domain-containing protein [Legionella sp. D16C41]|uniref:J domain-containing protein n=1 Tax=Legionella sp. D16C41 TaxID=3402688 RepID=UPI003AF51695
MKQNATNAPKDATKEDDDKKPDYHFENEIEKFFTEHEKNCYEILGVPPTAEPSEIKDQYRKLARQYHPDRNPGGDEKFKEISAAYDILSNKEKKAYYDRLLATKLAAQPTVKNHGFAPSKKEIVGLIKVRKIPVTSSNFIDGVLELLFVNSRAAQAFVEEWNERYANGLVHHKFVSLGQLCVSFLEPGNKTQQQRQHIAKLLAEHNGILNTLEEYYIIAPDTIEYIDPFVPSQRPTPKKSPEPTKGADATSSMPQPEFVAGNRRSIDGLCSIKKKDNVAEDRSHLKYVSLKFNSSVQAKQFVAVWNRNYAKDSLLQLITLDHDDVTAMVILDRGFVEKYNAELNATKTNACDIITSLMQQYFNIDKFVDVKAAQTEAAKTTTTPSPTPAKPAKASFTPTKPTKVSTSFFHTTPPSTSASLDCIPIPGLEKIIKLDTNPNADNGFLLLKFKSSTEAQNFRDVWWRKYAEENCFEFISLNNECCVNKLYGFNEHNIYPIKVQKQSIYEIVLSRLQSKYYIPSNIISDDNLDKQSTSVNKPM